MAVALLSWAIVAAADITSRSRVTAANFQLRALPTLTTVTTPAGVPGTSAGLWVHVTGEASDELALVVGSRTTTTGVTEFLVANDDATPIWHPLGEIDHFKTMAGAPNPNGAAAATT